MSAPPIQAREATREDLPHLFSMLAEQAEEMALFSVAPEKMAAGVMEAMEEGVCLVIDETRGEGLSAALGLVPRAQWYSDEAALSNLFLYVKPERRGARVERRLLEAARAFAEDRGLPLLLSRTRKGYNPSQRVRRICDVIGFLPFGHESLIETRSAD